MHHQPPIVEAEFFDSDGRRQTFVDKVAIFTSDWLDANSEYPQPADIRCEALARWRDSEGRELVRVMTEVESTEGRVEFVVLASQFCPPLSGTQTQPSQ